MIIVVTGPESCGKTTLSRLLAAALERPWVEEHARGYLERLPRPYRASDLLHLAEWHLDAEAKLDAPVCDTDLQVLRIWWSERYGPIPAALQEAYANQLTQPRYYLLCAPDIAWQPDPLREHPGERERLYELYLNDLQRCGVGFYEVHGQGDHRLRNALRGLAEVGIIPA
ncbi:MAG: ATP-binding protein [Pseudomonadota bacterium]